MEPLSKKIFCSHSSGSYRVSYCEWPMHNKRKSEDSEEHAETLICVHGLTGNATGFEVLAKSFTKDASSFHYDSIVCPDVVGRGNSDWLPLPQDYGYPRYQIDMASIIAATSNGRKVDWIGTSMGGIIGMILASFPNSPIRKLVLNDVGPFVPRQAILRIADYVSKTPSFENFNAAIEYFKKKHKSFALTEEQWVTLTKNNVEKVIDNSTGMFRLRYDPNIGLAFQNTSLLQDMDLWTLWDKITIPVMVLRGTESDLLTKEIVQEMSQRGPKLAKIIECEGVGHAPMLLESYQIESIKQFLME